MKKNKLDIAKNLLSSGELVIFPTETVFGLGADATNDEAVKSIFKVKKRPRSNSQERWKITYLCKTR